MIPKSFFRRSESMKQRQLEHPGSGVPGRFRQRLAPKPPEPRKRDDRVFSYELPRGEEGFIPAKKIDPGIMAATFQELIDAGWGSFSRWDIPGDWKTRRPNANADKAKAQ